MKERQLSLTRNEDPTIVVLNEKQRKQIEEEYNNLRLVLTTLFEKYNNKELTEGEKEMFLSVSETYLIDMFKEFKYDSNLEKQRQERFVEIRSLNQENRALREQLGLKVTNEDFRERIKIFAKQFRIFWNIEGFGHVSEFKFSESGHAEILLSGMITEAYYSENEIDKDEKVTALKAKGFEVDESDGYQIISTENNIRLLQTLLKSKYPSVHIFDYRTYITRNNISVIREVKIFIDNLNDFF